MFHSNRSQIFNIWLRMLCYDGILAKPNKTEPSKCLCGNVQKIDVTLSLYHCQVIKDPAKNVAHNEPQHSGERKVVRGARGCHGSDP